MLVITVRDVHDEMMGLSQIGRLSLDVWSCSWGPVFAEFTVFANSKRLAYIGANNCFPIHHRTNRFSTDREPVQCGAHLMYDMCSTTEFPFSECCHAPFRA